MLIRAGAEGAARSDRGTPPAFGPSAATLALRFIRLIVADPSYRAPRPSLNVPLPLSISAHSLPPCARVHLLCFCPKPC